MSKQREALKLALDALESDNPDIMLRAGIAIREALAEPEKANQCGETCERAKLCAVCANGLAEPEQEPVAWMCSDESMTHKGYSRFARNKNELWNIPVYTTPPTRKPLTDEEIDNLELPPNGCTMRELVRAIERAHGITE